MCKQDDTIRLEGTWGGPIGVDRCIAPIVEALNLVGIRTIASCCGHGHRPGNIILEDGREVIIARSFEDGRKIDRLFPDIQGNPQGEES